MTTTEQQLRSALDYLLGAYHSTHDTKGTGAEIVARIDTCTYAPCIQTREALAGPKATEKCGKCGKADDDGIFVVVCRHVLEDDFDEDDDGERVPRIQVVTALPSKPGPTRHRCGDPWCPQTELCAPCATNL